MAATPELRPSSAPVELKLRILTLPPAKNIETVRPSSAEADDNGEEECRTPTAKESKIPAMSTCPPAPRKAKRLSDPRKRRLSDLELIRVSPDLMARLFRPLDDPRLAAPLIIKKRKRCYPGYE
ncbi:unnamed protein product [Spirodela intermedia]|uniref:Uncharacterized protein n=1 Tax=Spirodela intermedia TaxID=51605 RepID=A0A7I8ICT1_SPIIN|nr:unnamed protein product [Spirodela intermedia]CAA6655566.1 unnamed protein product [Spirodela intermedia]